MPNDNVYEVEIITLVYGGDSLGRLPDGRAVFVPGALPGEKVRLRLVEQGKKFARGELLDLLTTSPDRIATGDAQARTCGGCHYQHMRYDAQLRAKTNIIRDQFQRIAGVQNPPVEPIIPSQKEWNYRSTVQFHLTPEGKLGFQEPGSHRVVPVTECAICEDAINEVLPLLDFEGAFEEGALDSSMRIVIRAGVESDVMMIFESENPDTPELNVEMPISIVHLISDDAGNTSPIVLAGDDHVVMEAMGRAFRVSAGSFFQVNTLQAENMVRYLLENLPLDPEKSLLEVYAGVGLFSAFLAPRVGQLTAVESAHSSIDDFATNLDEFENVAVYEGLAEDVLPALEFKPDICVVDPPRAGLALPALDAIVRMAPATLAYISCDPATLARDTKRLLAAGYRLVKVQPFDMFPQTYHIESISIFELNASAK